MSAIVGFSLRLALFLILYLFLYLALRIIWKSINQKEPHLGNMQIPAIQLISVDDVNWPHKVYYQGTIRKMGKREFEQLT